MRKLSTKNFPSCKEILTRAQTLYWYGLLQQRFMLEAPDQMERFFEGDRERISNKWRRYPQGVSPRADTLAMVEMKAPGSTRAFEHPLWEVLDLDNRKVMQGEALLHRLIPAIPSVLFNTKRIGMFSYLERRPIQRFLLKQLELKADLDVLACLIWLFREAAEKKCSKIDIIMESLHRVLLMMIPELHALKVARPLLEIVIDRLSPLGLPPYYRMAMSPAEYINSATALTALTLQAQGRPETLTGDNWLKVQYKLMVGKYSFLIQSALQPRLELDENHPEVTMDRIVFHRWVSRNREEAWACLLADEPDWEKIFPGKRAR